MKHTERNWRTRPLGLAAFPLGLGFGAAAGATDVVAQAVVVTCAVLVVVGLQVVAWWASDERTRLQLLQVGALAFALCIVMQAGVGLVAALGGPAAGYIERTLLLLFCSFVTVNLFLHLREWLVRRAEGHQLIH